MARYAAVDIGSNSIRMLAAEATPGVTPVPLASDREVTRLGSSVFSTGRVSEEAIDNVCNVLRRMARAYRDVDVVAVRAVATSAIRDASNQAEFVERASNALGTSVEIISGQEEARLIHMGVQSRWPHPDSRLLIMDVGGGSAEFIVAQNGEMREGISRQLGAVRLNEMFLRDDPPTSTQLIRLEKFIDEKFHPVLSRIQSRDFDRMVATSATAAAIVSAIHRIPRDQRELVDRLRAKTTQVRKLYRELASRGLADRRRMPGIGPRRAEIIVAGAAVFWRVMQTLEQSCMYYSAAGVREGIIADLATRGGGREASRLSRQQVRVLEAMCRKYNVNLGYARQVAKFSAELFDAAAPLHRLRAEMGKLLQTAAFLHDIGHFVSDTGHHKHSAYLVDNSDLPGYTDQERRLIAMLCRYHRKSLPTTRHVPFRELTQEARAAIGMLTSLLRLAIALDNSKEQRVRDLRLHLNGNRARLELEGESDFDLEVWAAERAAAIFRQVYGIPLEVEKSS